jgi:GNAT superfamily N-acetyltransferase
MAPAPERRSSVPRTPDFRTATTSDAERLGRGVVEGFEGYRSFAPPGWAPPSLTTEVELLSRLLGDAEVWCLLAETEGELVGQVGSLPAARAIHPVDDPALAHLRNLFVRPDFWGTGLASTLHAAAIEAARERGFAEMRLFTPADHGRARRFYEREGWVAAGEEFHDPGPDLVLIEYRHALRRPAT